MPEMLFLLLKMPLHPGFDAVLGAAGIDIVTSWEGERSLPAHLDRRRLSQVNQKLI